MFKRVHFKLQKKYFAFFTVVPLLLITALIKVPCPVCGGTGYISGSGMGQVTILKTDSTLVYSGDVTGCFNYRTYIYNVVVAMQNAGSVDGSGYIKVVLLDYTTSRILSSQYSKVFVPANTQASNAFKVVFNISLDSPTTTLVKAETVPASVECQTCGGTGKVPLNDLLFARALKQNILETQQVGVSPFFAAPVQEGNMPEIDVGQENNTNS